MEDNKNEINQYGVGKTPRIWSGIILLIAGLLLLAYKMGAPIPGWVFTWPVLLIAIGFLTGVKNRFHNPGAFILIAIGGIFLIDQLNPQFNFHNYILPVILIAVGLVYIMRPGRTYRRRRSGRWDNRSWEQPFVKPSEEKSFSDKTSSNDEDDAEFVQINAVLGGVKKIILSKNFKGGEINCFMGGAELNLLKADINKTILLEVNNVFGGTKLIVPTNWDVKNGVTAIFGGIEDKRNIISSVPDPNKIILLKGTCVFGGIEITNY